MTDHFRIARHSDGAANQARSTVGLLFLPLTGLFSEGCVRCNPYPRRRIINGYGEEPEHVIPNQLAGVIGRTATAHGWIQESISAELKRFRLSRCSLDRSAEPDAALCRSARLKLRDNRVVHRIARADVDQEAVLHSDRSGQYKLSLHE